MCFHIVSWVRLSARTFAFHVNKTGSIPVPSTNQGDAAVMVWQGTVNPPTYVTTGSIPVISTKQGP